MSYIVLLFQKKSTLAVVADHHVPFLLTMSQRSYNTGEALFHRLEVPHFKITQAGQPGV